MNTNSELSKSILFSPWTYFAVAYGWSWTFWGLAARLGISLNTASGIGLEMLGLLGPAIAGIGLTYLTQGKTGRHDYWQRVIDTKRISLRWYAIILLFFPALSVLAALLDVLSGGSGATMGGAVKHLALIPTLITLFFPAFMEELGWRGYALDRLQWRWSALVSSLILGILWAFWHTPLFFFKDTIMYNMGFGSLAFWTFIISTICPTIYLTWIFNNTNRSTLSGILWHASANGWAALFTLTALASHYLVVLWILAVIAIILLWGPGTLMGKGATRQSLLKLNGAD
jgi:membrane protease YdiL (CAAX protease family)